jgi:DNA processing protein
MEDLKYFLGFAAIDGFGPQKFKRLLSAFPDLSVAWRANLPELLAIGFNEKEAEMIIIGRSTIKPGDELEKMLAAGISAITCREPAYPKNLKEIYNPPAVLFYRGNFDCLRNDCLAVVGSRKSTSYGQSAINQIVKPLTQAGITIVSGLALGIDALAHQAALEAGGLTAAVLGSDLDFKNIGPKTNFRLAEEILDSNGCLVSEFPLGVPPQPGNFPQRNRIISGLSRGILIIEAAKSSGSLITAACGLEQNRDIFAIPGSIFNSSSEGANDLIKKGAKLVSSAEDIINELSWQTSLNLNKKTVSIATDETEKLILETLYQESADLDKLSEILKMGISVLNSKLMILELNGLIQKIEGGKYIRKNN